MDLDTLAQQMAILQLDIERHAAETHALKSRFDDMERRETEIVSVMEDAIKTISNLTNIVTR